MSDVAGLDRFREELSAQIGGLVPSELCSDLTEQLASVPFQQRINLLAHKCHLPKSGCCRHTICYTITPPI